VFISSTSDLAAEREALASKLPPAYAPSLYERDRAGSKSPEERCQGTIEQLDVFVCLLGERYGSLYSFDVGPRSMVGMARPQAEDFKNRFEGNALTPTRRELNLTGRARVIRQGAVFGLWP
jgi:hypothetical protein